MPIEIFDSTEARQARIDFLKKDNPEIETTTQDHELLTMANVTDPNERPTEFF